mmetsp:Transcript_609/g.1435  ORF Transcript_609/g.1435 Transcript_609/m.1435 type:complete len:209 (-) Transcript_609:685-1311(-)
MSSRATSMESNFSFDLLSSFLTPCTSSSRSRAFAGESSRSSRSLSTKVSSASPANFFLSGVSDSSSSSSSKRASRICSNRRSKLLSGMPSAARDFLMSTMPVTLLHSSLVTKPSLEESMTRKASPKESFRSARWLNKPSSWAVSSITRQRTPISMFSNVQAEMQMKAIKAHISSTLSSLIAKRVCARLSPRTPLVKSVIIESPMLANR